MAMSVGHSEYVHHVLPFSVFFQNVCMPISLQLFFFSPIIFISEGSKICLGFFLFLILLSLLIFHLLSKKFSFQKCVFGLYYLILTSFYINERECNQIVNYTSVCSSNANIIILKILV